MNASTVEVFHAPDLLELLAPDPDLLAVADAIAVTRPAPHARRHRRRLLLLAAAAILAVAIAAPAFGVVHLIADFFSRGRLPRDDCVLPSSMRPTVATRRSRARAATAPVSCPLPRRPWRDGARGQPDAASRG
jgi:hypothetical protein